MLSSLSKPEPSTNPEINNSIKQRAVQDKRKQSKAKQNEISPSLSTQHKAEQTEHDMNREAKQMHEQNQKT